MPQFEWGDGGWGNMKKRHSRRRVALGLVVPGLLALSCGGCGAAHVEGSGAAPGKGDSRLYKGCADGQGIEEIRRTYGLAIPADAANLRYCGQEQWSGSIGELQFDTNREGLDAFLRGSSPVELKFFRADSSEVEQDWQKVPQGAQIERASYTNRVDGCDNDVTVLIQQLRTDEVRVYLSMVCAS
ncbi:hypothetical protein ACFXJ6_21625 [Streptomyces sp. NPDC059218]|uniref:hypothetical protein n=1 Tax=unclassified Streptomyces TaxID=2593676 RepID=UPI00368A84F9